MKRGLLAAFLCAAGILPAMGADPQNIRYVSFLACPIARDTGPDTDMCFFAEHDGERVALLNPPDWGVPQLHHRVLVEGSIKEGAMLCGASVLEGRASVMPELDADCGVILPYDGVIKGAAGGVFNSGSPQQRAYAQELARRAVTEPRASIEPAILDPPPAPRPVAPFETRNLIVIYPFDSTRGAGPDMVKLRDLAEFSHIASARRITVVGYAAASRLADGTVLEEKEDLARQRAQKIGAILIRLGVSATALQVRWDQTPSPGTGRDDWRNRRVDINVQP